jgi:hypothetical protein
MYSDPNPVTTKTLNEIAKVICELTSELRLPELEPETTALMNLFHERAALVGRHVDNLVCELAAALMIDAMVAQHMHDLRLAIQSQPPFNGMRLLNVIDFKDWAKGDNSTNNEPDASDPR